MLELCLASSKSKAVNLDQYDKVFQVPQKLERLQACNVKEISPLRNRVIIESLSSLPEVQFFLKDIKDFIDSKLLEFGVGDNSDGSASNLPPGEAQHKSKLSVCICCSTGTHISACCVERLYEVYSRNRLIADLAVERHHEHATTWAKEMKKRCDLVWQQTRIPIKYFRSLEELQQDRMWCVVPIAIESLIEEEFQKDPFNSACVLDKYKVNFELGELYSERDLKTYRLRCVEGGLESRVDCSMVDGASYKKASKRFGAAGILCYSAHPTTGEVVFLLGHMNYSTRTWCDFGGLKSFREKPRQAAARECFEETLGVLGGVQELFEQLGNYKENHVFKIVNESCNYVSHFLRVPYDDYPDKFKKELLTNDCTLEVDDLKWFSLSSLREVLKKFLMGSDKLWAYPISPDGSVNREIYYCMREEFVQTMCMAEKLDILHSIEHIISHSYQRKRQGKSHQQQSGACAQFNSATEGSGLREQPDDIPGGELQQCGGTGDNTGVYPHKSDDGRSNEEVHKSDGTIRDPHISTEELKKLGLTSSSSREAQGKNKASSGNHCNRKHCKYMTYGIGVGKMLPITTNATPQNSHFSKFLHHP